MEFMNDQSTQILCLILASFRVYLEAIRFDFQQLPMTKALPKTISTGFHKWGLFASIGFIVFTAPGVLLS